MTLISHFLLLTVFILTFLHSALTKERKENATIFKPIPCIQHSSYEDLLHPWDKEALLKHPEKKSHEIISCYLQAAEQGDLRAQVMLGFAYLDGIGVQKDKEIAKECFQKACINGYKKSCDFYQNLTDGYW